MKTSKCLIFKADQQKFAIKTTNVVNILEKVRLVEVPIYGSLNTPIISFRGLNIPLINIREIMGMKSNDSFKNNCVLVVELKINSVLELVGISIDEIIEICELDDFMSYPYMPVSNSEKCEMREAIVLHNGEPVIVINANKISCIQHSENKVNHPQLFIPN